MGGGEDLGHAAGLRPVERVRHRHQLALVHDAQLGLAAAAHDRHHAIALGEARRARAERGDLAGELEPRDVRRRTRRGGVAALALEHVGAVEPGGADAHEHLAGAGLGIGALLNRDVPVGDHGCPHGAAVYSRGVVRPISDSTILVTGATDGLGRALAGRLARRRGAPCCCTAATSERLDAVAAELPGARTLQADFASLDEVRAARRRGRTATGWTSWSTTPGIGSGMPEGRERAGARDGNELRFAGQLPGGLPAHRAAARPLRAVGAGAGRLRRVARARCRSTSTT